MAFELCIGGKHRQVAGCARECSPAFLIIEDPGRSVACLRNTLNWADVRMLRHSASLFCT
jgi:hypothetical protein